MSLYRYLRMKSSGSLLEAKGLIAFQLIRLDLLFGDCALVEPGTSHSTNAERSFTGGLQPRERVVALTWMILARGEGDTCENRSDRRQWSHRIKAREQASRAWARSRG